MGDGPACPGSLRRFVGRGQLHSARGAAAADLGIPILTHDTLKQVVLLLTSAATPISRVIEIWRPRRDGKLRLETGYYGPLHEFAEISRQMTFAQGIGLPGRVFTTKLSVVFERLTPEAGFVRYDAAARAAWMPPSASPSSRATCSRCSTDRVDTLVVLREPSLALEPS